ncbi:alpha/beta fold hydrolase [Marinobacter caseinilyticus]|uniref:alpha/beta fold hydrolase n=1 Tax=Marinobacter caseinilyticus TaxID=2692195 RepID=UPI00140741F7|nr:alpha/beta hydrolase [Marinobacter caseinilyticus]
MANTIRHRRITVNDTSLHVAISAPDKPHDRHVSSARGAVLCLHGFPEGWVGWRPLMRQMPDVAFFAPDLRGYPASDAAGNGYDVFSLTDDIDQLITELGLDKPVLLSHDWGGALGWIYAHRFPERISRLVVVNCTHPRTLVRAVLRFEDFQTLRIPWVSPFQIPRLPERLLTTRLGRTMLTLSFTLRKGSRGHMDRDLVREIVHRFERPKDLRGPVNYYREFVKTLIHTSTRAQLEQVYDNPIQVPVTLIWGLEDGALSARVAQASHRDAGCPVEWRPLEGIGHFVDLEAPDLLARELYRLLDQSDRLPAARSSMETAA